MNEYFSDALLDLELKGTKHHVRNQTLQRKRGSAHLDSQSGSSAAPLEKSARLPRGVKVNRGKFCALLVALDCMSVNVTGGGLVSFRVKDAMNEKSDPLTWPKTAWAPDQASEVISAKKWAKYAAKLNLEMCQGDLSHGLWNDCKGSLRSAAFWSSVLVGTIAMSTGCKPNSDAMWWRVCCEVLTEWFKFGQCSVDDLFSAFWMQAAEELDLFGKGMDSEAVKEEVWKVWQTHPTIWNKNEEINLCRWFKWIDASAIHHEVWTLKHLTSALMCIAMYKLDAAAYGKIAKLQEKSLQKITAKILGQDGDGSKMSLKEGKAEINSLRSLLNHSLLVQYYCFSDPVEKRNAKMITTVLTPARLWHSEQSCGLRSVQECAEWTRQQHSGQALQPLIATLNVLTDVKDCHKMGFLVTGFDELYGQGHDHPLCAEEQGYAGMCFKLAVGFASRRLKRMCESWLAYPGRCNQFLSTNTNIGDMAVFFFKRDWDIYFNKVVDLSSKFWDRVKARSCFQDVATIQLGRICQENRWMLDEDPILSFLETRLGTLQTSKVVEDGVRVLRRAEQLSSSNSLGYSSLYSNLIQSDVLHQQHRYDHIGEYRLGAREAEPSPRRLYHLDMPSTVGTGLNFAHITEGGSNPDWPHHSVQTSPAIVGDLWLCRYCDEHDCWNYAESCWLSTIPGAQVGLVLGQKGKEKWHMSLGDLAGTGLLCCGIVGYPGLADGTHPGLKAWRPKFATTDFDGIEILTVLNIHDWEVLPMRVQSPIQRMLESCDDDKQGICLVEDGDDGPQGLLQHAAQHCFWDVTKACLQMLAKHLRIPAYKSSLSLYHLLRVLLIDILKINPATDAGVDKLCDTIALRCIKKDFRKFAFVDDKSTELLDKSDADQLEKDLATDKELDVDREVLTKALTPLMLQRKPLLRNLLSACKAKAQRSKVFETIKKRHGTIKQYDGMELPDDITDFDSEIMTMFCPPGWSIYRDDIGESRWLLRLPDGLHTRSRAFSYGLREAVVQLLIFGWFWWLYKEGLTLFECPIGKLDLPCRSGDLDVDGKALAAVTVIL